MNGAGREERPGRESRLLMLVVLVAIIVLMVLARFRFPAADLTTMTPVANPLERLAARAPLEDVTEAVSGVLQKVTPWLAVVQLEPPGEALEGTPPSDAPDPPEATPLGWVPAVRVSDDLAVFGRDGQVTAGAVLDEVDRPLVIEPAVDSGFAFVPLAPGTVPASLMPSDDLPAFSFVVAVEAGRGGLSARPLFLGRLDPVEFPPVSSFVLVAAGDPGLSPGDVLFTFSGQFVGLVIAHDRGLAIVPPRALSAAAERVAHEPAGESDVQADDVAVDDAADGGADRGGS